MLEREMGMDRIANVLQQQLSYPSEQIVRQFDFITSTGGRHTADLVAFSEAHRHDLATSCIAVEWKGNGNGRGLVRQYRYLAAPHLLVATPESVEVWGVAEHAVQDPRAVVRYEDLNGYFSTNRMEFAPRTIADFKRGRQLTLFDLDPNLLQFAGEITRRLLTRRISDALNGGYDILSRLAPQMLLPPHARNSADLITKVTVYTLAALVLRDKRLVTMATDAQALMRHSREAYPGYFRWDDVADELKLPAHISDALAENAFGALSYGDVTFRSVSGELLGHLYENTMVSADYRRENGIHYTPSALATMILERLPLELLPADEPLLMADGSCGSGSLLVAAYERLERILGPEPFHSRQEEIRKHIMGVDRDQFAREFARLALLLRSLGDSWNIQRMDFLADRAKDILPSPNVIVGNPPFLQTDGEQQAARFLNEYLTWIRPHGLIGIVMPQSYLTSNISRASRQRLLREADLLELWQLPRRQVIKGSCADLAVLLLQKRACEKAPFWPVKVMQVPGEASRVREFLATQATEFTFTVPSQSRFAEPACVIAPSPMEEILFRLGKLPRLGSIASCYAGLKPGPLPEEDYASEPHGPEYRPWLGGATWISPYHVNWKGQKHRYARWPGSFREPKVGEENVLRSHKVLVNANATVGMPRRLFAAIDRQGLFPMNGLHYVLPRDAEGTPLEVIVGVLNHSVSNLWVTTKSRQQYISTGVIADLPWPALDRADIDEIVSLVRTVESGLMDNIESSAFRQESGRIEAILNAGYGLSAIDAEAVSGFLGSLWSASNRQDRGSESGRLWLLVGQVVEVDGAKGEVVIQSDDWNDGQPFTTTIPPAMPGWALRPGVVFEALLPIEVVHQQEASNPMPLKEFRPLPPAPDDETFYREVAAFFGMHSSGNGGVPH